MFLEGHSSAQEDMVHKGRCHKLEPDGHPIIAEPARYTQCRDTCQICRDGVDVEEIDTQRVVHHFIKTEGGQFIEVRLKEVDGEDKILLAEI